MSFICHIHNYTEYNQQWNVFSAFNPSKYTHTPGAVDTHTHTHLEQWTHTHTHLEQWTHTHTHTHLEQWAVRGAVGGSVPCSRVSPQSWTVSLSCFCFSISWNCIWLKDNCFTTGLSSLTVRRNIAKFMSKVLLMVKKIKNKNPLQLLCNQKL